MKIFGVAPSRRAERGDQPSNTGGDEKLVCRVIGAESVHALPQDAASCAKCLKTEDYRILLCAPCEGLTQQFVLSEGCQRLLTRVKRSPPVDVSLECPPLQSARDVQAVIFGIATSGADGVRTLSLGPWGSEHVHCHNSGSGCGPHEIASSEDATGVLQCLTDLATIWQTWPLKAFAVYDLRLADCEPLSCALRALPKANGAGLGLQTVRLSGLRVASSSWLSECVGALMVGYYEGLRLDLSNNNLTDSDAFILQPLLEVPCMSAAHCAVDGLASAARIPPVSRLVLSGNPRITNTGLRQLLTASTLEALDVSECNLGFEGALTLADHLASPKCILQELSAYRTGLGCDGVRRLVDATAVSTTLRSLNVVANGQHVGQWSSTMGSSIAAALRASISLRVLTISCPEAEMKAARQLFVAFNSGDNKDVERRTIDGDGAVPTSNGQAMPRVILVPNEQNNYNRALFSGHVH